MATKSNNKTSNKPAVGYVDGFVLVIKKDQVARYKKMAKEVGEAWIKHGALGLKECIGDDINPDMKDYPFMPFPKLTKLKDDETVWFSYIEYESKRQRNQVNAKVEKEMEEWSKNKPEYMKGMPFDMKKMSYAGFKVAVSY